jgi:hypothetical protein
LDIWKDNARNLQNGNEQKTLNSKVQELENELLKKKMLLGLNRLGNKSLDGKRIAFNLWKQNVTSASKEKQINDAFYKMNRNLKDKMRNALHLFKESGHGAMRTILLKQKSKETGINSLGWILRSRNRDMKDVLKQWKDNIKSVKDKSDD